MNKEISIQDLDFESIKENLKDYLKSQSKFKDYDFEGSALNVLLNTLAYNTLMQSFYVNMSFNESFLSTAQKRESVVKRAKDLGYQPNSVRCSMATLKISINNPKGSPQTINLPTTTYFEGMNEEGSFDFKPTRGAIIYKKLDTEGNAYWETEIDVIQGFTLSKKYTNLASNPKQRFLIPNPGADIEQTRVFIYENSTTTDREEFKPAESVLDLDSESKVFFTNEVEKGQYEIFFGDGVIGRQLMDGNVVEIQYTLSEGSKGNNCKQFRLKSTISGNTDVTITPTMPSYGGDDVETIESIKFHAPRNFEGQDRCVTVRDYKTNISKIYPNAASVSVWGGEDNIPPKFGRVLIGLKPKTGEEIPNSVKNNIVKKLSEQYSIVGITPEIVDPDYLYLELSSTVKYDETRTVLDSNRISEQVLSEVARYVDSELSNFDNYFRYSKFMGVIDNSNESIISNSSSVVMKKFLEFTLGVAAPHNIYFFNPLKPGSIRFTTCDIGNIRVSGTRREISIMDNSNGVLIGVDKATGTTVYPDLGTVDYENGVIALKEVSLSYVESGEFLVRAVCQTLDVYTRNNQIIRVEPSDININVIEDLVL